VSTFASRASAPAAAALALGAYWVATPYINDNTQNEMLRATQAVVMTVNCAIFIGAFWRAFLAGVPNSVRRFYLGLILWASAADGGAVWRLLWRKAGMGPELNWMLTNDAVAFLLWVEIVGVFLMISGPNVQGKANTDHINWWRLGITTALCVAVTYVVVFSHFGSEQTHAVLDVVKGWIAP
jgi:hypothetical protein